MSQEIYEKACRLIKAATGEEYGDGYTVTDIVTGYAEPGYGSNDSVVVFGNWNDRNNYGEEPTKDDTIPSRLGNALERIGASIEWLDEWASCSECDRAVRTQPDSYSWTMFGTLTNSGFICGDCFKRDLEDYLEDYLNDSGKALSFVAENDLPEGFRKWNEHSFQNGWYQGQNDDPSTIMGKIHEAHPDSDVVFLIDDVGQFDIAFSAFFRESAQVSE